jgi:hypothetical protein
MGRFWASKGSFTKLNCFPVLRFCVRRHVDPLFNSIVANRQKKMQSALIELHALKNLVTRIEGHVTFILTNIDINAYIDKL